MIYLFQILFLFCILKLTVAVFVNTNPQEDSLGDMKSYQNFNLYSTNSGPLFHRDSYVSTIFVISILALLASRYHL